MTPAAEFVNRLFQHELLVSGMRVMADNAASSGYNPVDIRHTFRRLLGDQPLLITMAGQAKLQRAFFNELIPVVFTMGIMAESAAPNRHGAMNELHREPDFFACVTAKTKLLDVLIRETDFQWFDRLLMTCKALLIERCAVLPGSFISDIPMAIDTGGRIRQAHGREGAGRNQFMAILAVGG